MAIRKYYVEVTRTTCVHVEIDDEKLDQGYLEEFERSFWVLPSSYESLAQYIACESVDEVYIENDGLQKIRVYECDKDKNLQEAGYHAHEQDDYFDFYVKEFTNGNQ